MNACVNVLFWEGSQRNPKGDHTLGPEMRKAEKDVTSVQPPEADEMN
jgi:hypothetical protein